MSMCTMMNVIIVFKLLKKVLNLNSLWGHYWRKNRGS